jgi:hypothetical protein
MATAKITLGETEFTIHPLTIGEIEDVTDGTGKAGYKALEFAMRRAEPAVVDFRSLTATPKQIGEAIRAVFNLSGFEIPENPPEAVPPAAS